VLLGYLHGWIFTSAAWHMVMNPALLLRCDLFDKFLRA
jgi:hypothetical protein